MAKKDAPKSKSKSDKPKKPLKAPDPRPAAEGPSRRRRRARARAPARSARRATPAPQGFMLFSKEMRPKVKEDFPDLTFGGIGKKLGELWRELDDEAKEKYKEPAE